MARELVKDFYNRIIGSIETKPNGDQVLRDFHQKILGFYYHSDNTTRDFNRRILTHGNTLMGLLYNENKKF